MIHYPLMVDGQYFENTKIAHRAVFPNNEASYFQLQRALKRGRGELFGHKIERLKTRYVIQDDGEITAMPPRAPKQKERGRGEPLLRYPPGEDPLSRGLQRWH